MTYKHLIFGKYDMKEVQKAVGDSSWQAFREGLKGLSTSSKLKALESWVREYHQKDRAKVQVTNYVYALKRAGLVK